MSRRWQNYDDLMVIELQKATRNRRSKQDQNAGSSQKEKGKNHDTPSASKDGG